MLWRQSREWRIENQESAIAFSLTRLLALSLYRPLRDERDPIAFLARFRYLQAVAL